jgi:hypothetical protein
MLNIPGPGCVVIIKGSFKEIGKAYSNPCLAEKPTAMKDIQLLQHTTSTCVPGLALALRRRTKESISHKSFRHGTLRQKNVAAT